MKCVPGCYSFSVHGIDLVKTIVHALHLANSAVNFMASRQHHGCLRRQNHHVNIPLVATSSRCCTYGDSTPCCTQSNHPSPPPLPDNIVHLVASYLQIQQQETQCPDQNCSCETPCRGFNGIRRQGGVLHQQKNVPREHDHVILSSLLRKIDNLESSLNHFAARYDKRCDGYTTLRDSAARVIQTHFRSYLVRRSISFRHLKELATIKSSFVSLKSSVWGKPHFPFKTVSRKATDLLLQLDSIQGRIDPMIRNSKRSLGRDLVRFLQYIDDCAVRRFEFVSKSAKNVCFVGSHSRLRGYDGKKPQGFGVAEGRKIETLRNQMGKVFVTSDEDEDSNAELEELDSMTDDSEEVPLNSIDNRKIGSSKFVKGNVVKPPVGKSMVMGKNRNEYQVYGKTRELNSSEENDSVDSGEEVLVLSRDNERKHGSKTRNMVLVKGSGGKTRVVKTVSFDENGNVYKVYGDTPESSISEENDSTSGSNDGNGEKKVNGNEVEIKYVPRENEGFEAEEEEEESRSENEVSSSEGSEGDAIVTRDNNHLGSNEHKREIQLRKGSLTFSPPMPLKMEP